MNLTRYCYSPTETLGVLRIGEHEFFTIERPWIPDHTHGSRPSESCIPDGAYELVPHEGTRYKKTWALVNPELLVYQHPEAVGRSAILFHVGNWADDVIGCIAPGTGRRVMRGAPAVTGSGNAMEKIRDLLVVGTAGHRMTIRCTAGAKFQEKPHV